MKNQHTEISCAFTHQKLNIWKRIKESNSISNSIKNNKTLGNKFKEVEDLYNENYKALMKTLNKI